MIAFYYASRFGLARGAVFVAGRPHLYMEGLETDLSLGLVGVSSIARLKGRGGGVAFLDLADGSEAILELPPPDLARLADGEAVEIAIAAEARRDKLARARLVRVAHGEALRRLSPPMPLKSRLLAEARACFGDATVDMGPAAAADEIAERLDEACDASGAGPAAPSSDMPGGGALHIERTRALTACDVDGGGLTEARAKTNLRAVVEVVRRLRLMGLGGLVVVDLIGRRHDDKAVHAALLAAFGTEAATIIPAPVGKFGTLEFVRPWRVCPPADAPATLRQAARLLRDAARQALHQPGRRLTLRAPADVLDRVHTCIDRSFDPLTPLLRLEAGPICEVNAS
jgi:hypothetical protein